MPSSSRRLVTGALVVFLCMVWGSTWLAIKVGLADMPPFFSAGLRFMGAAAILFVLAIVQRVPAPRTLRLHAGLLALGIAVHSVSYGAVYWSEQYLSSGLAAVLFAIYPLLVALLAARVFPDERLTPRKLTGIALGFAGVAVIFLDDITLDHSRAPLAAAVLLLSPLMGAFSSVSIKRFGHDLHPYTLTSLPMLYGGVTLLLASLLTEDWGPVKWTASAVGAVLYLTVFGSALAFVGYYTVLKRVAVSRLALISYIFPVVAVVLGMLLLGERLGLQAWAGSALVLAGVALAGFDRRPPVPPAGGDEPGALTPAGVTGAER